jgi:hypothetical protein
MVAIGPSYALRNRSGPKQRAVNLIPVPVEAPGEPTRNAFKDFPGLVEFADLGGSIRGAINSNGRVLVVSGGYLLELASDGSSTSLGSIAGTSWADFAANATQICVTDGSSLYVLNRATNALTLATGYPGGPRIAVLNEFLFGIESGSGRLWWSNVGDASVIDGLSFATAESSPDNLTACIVSNEELLLIGKSTIEPWRVIGGDDVVTKTGRVIEVGSESPFSVRRLDNSVFFVGSSEEFGQGVVYRLNGYTPQRISTRAEEEMLSGIDLSDAYAYSMVFEGNAMYCLQVPALDTTMVYDVASRMWSEAAELVNGEYAKHRGNVHLFAFNKTLVGADDGKLYQLDATASSNAGDVLCRSRVMPVAQRPDAKRIRFPELQVICDTGAGGNLMVRWSDDGGNQWGDWEYISLGDIGNFDQDVSLHAMGSAHRRVYELRVTDDVPWNPSDVIVRTV